MPDDWKPRAVTEDGQGIYVMSDMPMGDGRTLREHNMEKTHVLPLGALVEVEVTVYSPGYDENPAHVDLKGTCKLYVVGHGRDCDGTPLYSLSDIPVKWPEGTAFSKLWMEFKAFSRIAEHGYSAESLTDTGFRRELHDRVGQYLGVV